MRICFLLGLGFLLALNAAAVRAQEAATQDAALQEAVNTKAIDAELDKFRDDLFHAKPGSCCWSGGTGSSAANGQEIWKFVLAAFLAFMWPASDHCLAASIMRVMSLRSKSSATGIDRT